MQGESNLVSSLYIYILIGWLIDWLIDMSVHALLAACEGWEMGNTEESNNKNIESSKTETLLKAIEKIKRSNQKGRKNQTLWRMKHEPKELWLVKGREAYKSWYGESKGI